MKGICMSEKMNEQEANEKISELLAKAFELISQAEEIADAAGITFDFDLAYGMGGTYVPESLQDEYGDAGWQSSSSMC